jgi:DNA-binding transcriptional ArsR family regulator
LCLMLDRSQPRDSNHLARMRCCALLRTRRDHRRAYYRVADQRVTRILALARALVRDRAGNITLAVLILSRPLPTTRSRQHLTGKLVTPWGRG